LFLKIGNDGRLVIPFLKNSFFAKQMTAKIKNQHLSRFEADFFTKRKSEKI